MKPNVYKLALCALFVAMGITLPMAFHAIPNAGGIFLPMHIPVLVCGLVLGWPYGLACGILAPLLSSILTGMPPIARLPGMLCELAAYGLVAGILTSTVKTKRPLVNTAVALVGAMVVGRLVMGVLNALIFKAGAYSMQLWLAGSFVTALPGIAIQLIVIPPLASLITRVRRPWAGEPAPKQARQDM